MVIMDFGYYNADCMEVMKTFADKEFDLAIVDPPYGIGINHNMGRRKGDKKSTYSAVYWDNSIPQEEYFQELFRVSKSAIIWGGNYFPLPPTKCFLVWRKPQISEGVSFSMLEYAWTNIDNTSKEFIGMSNEKDRMHPTQKPVKLYAWILNNFAQPGMKILDTHGGSMSSMIVCHRGGYEATCIEMDKTYYEKAKQRLIEEVQQGSLFIPNVEPINEVSLF